MPTLDGETNAFCTIKISMPKNLALRNELKKFKKTFTEFLRHLESTAIERFKYNALNASPKLIERTIAEIQSLQFKLKKLIVPVLPKDVPEDALDDSGALKKIIQEEKHLFHPPQSLPMLFCQIEKLSRFLKMHEEDLNIWIHAMRDFGKKPEQYRRRYWMGALIPFTSFLSPEGRPQWTWISNYGSKVGINWGKQSRRAYQETKKISLVGSPAYYWWRDFLKSLEREPRKESIEFYWHVKYFLDWLWTQKEISEKDKKSLGKEYLAAVEKTISFLEQKELQRLREQYVEFSPEQHLKKMLKPCVPSKKELEKQARLCKKREKQRQEALSREPLPELSI